MKNILYIFIFAALTANTFAQLKIIHPNGGERLQAGSETRVLWEGVPDSAKVSIKFSSDSGKNWQRISNDTNKNNTSWITPNIESDSCIINILSYTNNTKFGQIEFSKILGGYSEDYSVSILETDDGGFIIVGNTTSDDGIFELAKGSDDIFVIKLSKEGNTEWVRIFGGPSYDNVEDLIQTEDGGYLVLGYTLSQSGDFKKTNGLWDTVVFKINAEGELEWSENYGGQKTELGHSIIQTEDGNYVIVGEGNSIDGDFAENFGSSDITIMKIDPKGKLLWVKEYGGSEQDIAESVYETENGDLIITGSTKSADGLFSDNKGTFDMFLMKTDSDGNLIWLRTYGASSADYGNYITQSDDGNYIVSGTTGSIYGNTTTKFGKQDAWMVKVTPEGELIWSKNYGGSEDDYLTSFCRSNDNTFIIAIASQTNDGIFPNNFGSYDVWILKISNEGEIIWSKQYGGSKSESSSCLTLAKNNDLIITGQTSSTDGDFRSINFKTDVWVARISNDFIVNESATSDSTFSIVNPTSSIINSDNNINFTVRPNIASNTANVSVELIENGATTLELFDSQGRKMQTILSGVQASGIKEIPIDVSQYLSGRYYLKLTTPTISKTEILEVQR